MQTEECKFNIIVDKYSKLIVGYCLEFGRLEYKDEYSRRFAIDIIDE
jgi:hypothetical protein